MPPRLRSGAPACGLGAPALEGFNNLFHSLSDDTSIVPEHSHIVGLDAVSCLLRISIETDYHETPRSRSKNALGTTSLTASSLTSCATDRDQEKPIDRHRGKGMSMSSASSACLGKLFTHITSSNRGHPEESGKPHGDLYAMKSILHVSGSTTYKNCTFSTRHVKLNSTQSFRTYQLDTRRGQKSGVARRSSRMRRSLLFSPLTKNPASSTHHRPGTTSPRDLRSHINLPLRPKLRAHHGSRCRNSVLEAHLRGACLQVFALHSLPNRDGCEHSPSPRLHRSPISREGNRATVT